MILLGRQCDLVLLRFFQDDIHQFLIGLVRIRTANPSDVPYVLERVVRQPRRNNLERAVEHRDDRQKPNECLYCSHVSRLALGNENLSRPAEHSLKMFDYSGNRNIAHLASLA